MQLRDPVTVSDIQVSESPFLHFRMLQICSVFGFDAQYRTNYCRRHHTRQLAFGHFPENWHWSQMSTHMSARAVLLSAFQNHLCLMRCAIPTLNRPFPSQMPTVHRLMSEHMDTARYIRLHWLHVLSDH